MTVLILVSLSHPKHRYEDMLDPVVLMKVVMNMLSLHRIGRC